MSNEQKETFKQLEIEKSYIVYVGTRPKILYHCNYYGWFLTTNGGFGQLDYYLDEITEERAIELLNLQA